MFAGLLSEVHRLTLAKIGAPRDGALDAEATAVVEDHADRLSFPVLHRLWQLLLKGQEEVARASVPLDAADMALLRVVHAATLPDPGELAKMIGEGAFTAAPAPSASTTPAAHNAPQTANVQALMPATFHAQVWLLVPRSSPGRHLAIRSDGQYTGRENNTRARTSNR